MVSFSKGSYQSSVPEGNVPTHPGWVPFVRLIDAGTASQEPLDQVYSRAIEKGMGSKGLATLSVQRLLLEDGELGATRIAGEEVAFARGQIANDLR